MLKIKAFFKHLPGLPVSCVDAYAISTFRSAPKACKLYAIGKVIDET
jgi:hypothetical protein